MSIISCILQFNMHNAGLNLVRLIDEFDLLVNINSYY